MGLGGAEQNLKPIPRDRVSEPNNVNHFQVYRSTAKQDSTVHYQLYQTIRSLRQHFSSPNDEQQSIQNMFITNFISTVAKR